MNEDLKADLKKLIAEKPMNYGQCCNSKAYAELKSKIMAATPLLASPEFKFSTRVFWILNDITEFPKCYVCGKDITRNIRTLETGYNRNKPWKPEHLNASVCDCQKCRKQKNLDDFKKTCNEKYGVDNVFQSEWCKDKITKTNISRYGCTRGGNSKEGREKAKRTWLEKYGVDSPLKSDLVKEHSRQTCLKKYGVTHYAKTEESKTRVAGVHLKNMVERIKNDPEITFQDLNEFNQISSTVEIWDLQVHMKCKKCDEEFFKNMGFNNFYKYGTVSTCPNCHPSSCMSKPELDLQEFIAKYVSENDIVTNSRQIIKPFEIDIFLKTKNIAFEFDGLFWHSSKNEIPKDYHLRKTELCEARGIQLIHIFENEWEFKREIVESRIKSLLGIYDNTVFARKCEIKEIDSKTSKEFQEINHIQGSVNSSVNVGLYHGNELVSLMTFGKCRFDRKHEWEMLRFCNRLGHHVIGGAGKLLKYFEKTYKPKSLVSYADRRWSQGRLYNVLGFKLDHISKPDYWYWNYNSSNKRIESRIKYQKHKLRTLLKTFDPNKTEVENMKSNGYYQIYDCGNYVFEKTYIL